MADCGKGCAKCMLILFNIIFLITGAALFGVGLWIRFDKKIWDYIGFVSVNQNDPYIEYGAYLLVAVGAFILLTSILGCCGAITERKFCLGLYIFILVIVLLCEIAGGVLIILYQNKIKNEFSELALKEFKDPSANYHTDKWSPFATTLNLIQYEFKCCGIVGNKDYNSLNKTTYRPTCGEYPCSCFPIKSTATKKTPNDFVQGDIASNSTTPYTIGCETAIIDFFEKYSVVFIGLAIGFACIEMFGLIFAVCLCVTGGKGEK